jgi:hypothetical protein
MCFSQANRGKLRVFDQRPYSGLLLRLGIEISPYYMILDSIYEEEGRIVDRVEVKVASKEQLSYL